MNPSLSTVGVARGRRGGGIWRWKEFAVYATIAVIDVVCCTLAPIPQRGGSSGMLSHAQDRESWALGRLKWLPVPFNEIF